MIFFRMKEMNSSSILMSNFFTSSGHFRGGRELLLRGRFRQIEGNEKTKKVPQRPFDIAPIKATQSPAP